MSSMKSLTIKRASSIRDERTLTTALSQATPNDTNQNSLISSAGHLDRTGATFSGAKTNESEIMVLKRKENVRMKMR